MDENEKDKNPYLQALLDMTPNLAIVPDVTPYITTPEPLAEYGLNLLHCRDCGDSGTLLRADEGGVLWARECPCMGTRRSLRRLRDSGLADALERYSFETYLCPDEKRSAILSAARSFCAAQRGWFYIAGQSGSGKSHICTAICGDLLRKTEVRYMLWRDEIVSLKANVTNDTEYAARMRPLKNVPVLYIDDFLKGRITDADLNIAFELLDARYNDRSKRTIISSERTMRQLLELDEAVAGRIYERAKGFVIEAPRENWRFRA